MVNMVPFKKYAAEEEILETVIRRAFNKAVKTWVKSPDFDRRVVLGLPYHKRKRIERVLKGGQYDTV